MPRLSPEPLIKINLRVYRRDYEDAKRMATGTDGINEIFRRAISSYMRHAGDAIRRAIDQEERKLATAPSHVANHVTAANHIAGSADDDPSLLPEIPTEDEPEDGK